MPFTNDGFPRNVNLQPAPALAGDFAGNNPRCGTPSPPGGYTCVPEGVVVGKFAWGRYSTGLVSNYFQAEGLLGIVHREQQALVQDFLDYDNEQVLRGFPLSIMAQGDFWLRFAGAAVPGQTVYANAQTGEAVAAAAGQSTQSIGFTATLSAAGLLTVSVAGTGNIAVGMTVVGVGVPPGTFVLSLGTGTGGTGTYNLSQGVVGGLTSRVMSAFGLIATPWRVATEVKVDAVVTASIAIDGTMTVSAVSSGVLEAGQYVSGVNIRNPARLLFQVSGTPGGVGVYRVSQLAVSASATVTGSQGRLGVVSTWQDFAP